MFMLVCTLLLGFTGYSLVFEQLSYWGATVGANITDTVPVVGGLLKNLLLAGETYNDRTLARFFILHAAVLPVALIALIAVHIVIVRLQGVTELRFERERAGAPETFRFFPDHLYTELIIGLVLDDPAQHAGDHSSRDPGPAGRSAQHPGGHQAGVVLLCRLSAG